MIRLAIFDFDGTLVDTITDVALCFNRALTACGFPTHPPSGYPRFVGGNLETVISRLLPPDYCTAADIDRVKQVYRPLYLEDAKPNTRPYPGILPLLAGMAAQGIRLGVSTNKAQPLTEALCDSLFLPDTFAGIIGYDDAHPSKPDPYSVDALMAQCGVTAAETVYIGDGRTDLETAANAGVPCIFVTWGQGYDVDPQEAGIALAVNAPEDILAWMIQQNGGSLCNPS